MQNEPHSGSLKERFEGFGAAPSEELWGRIAGSLDEKKKRRGIIWWWFGGLAAVLVLSFGLYYAGYHQGLKENETIIAIEDQHSTTINNSDTASGNLILSENEDDLVVEVDHADNEGAFPDITDQKVIKSDDEHVKMNPYETLPINNSTDNQVEEVIVELEERDENIDRILLAEIEAIPNSLKLLSQPTLMLSPKDTVPDFAGYWFFGGELSYHRGISLFQPKYSLDQSLMWDSYSSGGNNTVTNSGASMLESYAPNPPGVIESFMAKPLSASFIAGRYFKKRWSWQTGLELSRSVYHTYYDTYDFQYARTSLWSLGIPVMINFDPVKRQRFKWQLGLGVVNEFPFIESIKESYYATSSKSSSFNLGYMGALRFDSRFMFQLGSKSWLGIAPAYRWYFIQRMDSQYPLTRQESWLSGTLSFVREF